jgi:hypothetical protein
MGEQATMMMTARIGQISVSIWSSGMILPN